MNLYLCKRLVTRLLLLGGLVFIPITVEAHEAVDEILIGIEGVSHDNQPQGWILIVELGGEEISSASFQQPGAMASTPLVVEPGGFEAAFESDLFQTTSALHQVFPTGTYSLTVNGTNTVDLMWNPPALTTNDANEPSVVNTMPAQHSTIPDTTPDFSYTTNCTNCDGFFELGIFNRSGDLGRVDGSFETMGGPFPTTVTFAQLVHQGTDGAIQELPALEYNFETFVSALLLTNSVEFTPPLEASSVFIAESGVLDASTFTVPEPSASATGTAVVALLTWMSRRRSRPPRNRRACP